MISKAVPPKIEELLPLLFAALALGAGGVAALLAAGGVNPLLLVVGVFGLAVVAFTVMRPQWGLALLIFLAYTRSSDVAVHFHGAPSILQPFLLVTLGVVLLRWRMYGERPVGWVQPLILLGLYGLVRYASLLYAANFEVAQDKLIIYLKDAIIAVILVMMLQRRATLHKAVWSLLVAGGFLGSISVFQYATQTFYNIYWGFADASVQHLIGDTGGFRIAGPIGDPNFYGQIIVPLVPIALERALHERSIVGRLLAFYVFAVCTITVIVTYSRGTFVAMAAAVGLYILYRGLRKREIVLAALLIIPALQFVPAEYSQRIMTMADILPWNDSEPTSEVSFRGRASEAMVAFAMFADRPLLGVGLNNYPQYYQTYSQRIGLDPRREQRAPHSLYLEIASETGFLGIFSFGAMMWGMFHGIWLARKRFLQAGLPDDGSMVVALGVGIIGYLIAAIFLHSAFARYLYLLFGIAMATPHIAQHTLAAQQLRLKRSKERARRRELSQQAVVPAALRYLR